jgi:hypothetical protein
MIKQRGNIIKIIYCRELSKAYLFTLLGVYMSRRIRAVFSSRYGEGTSGIKVFLFFHNSLSLLTIVVQ